MPILVDKMKIDILASSSDLGIYNAHSPDVPKSISTWLVRGISVIAGKYYPELFFS